MRGRNVFLLDLISNSLGAVLLLFLLLISRHFDRPPTRVEGTLFIAAEATRPASGISLWVQPPGTERPLFFAGEITGLDWSESTGAYRLARLPADRLSAAEFTRIAKFLRRAEIGEAATSAAAAAIPDPAVGCWVFGAYYEDSSDLLAPAPVETDIALLVWHEGPRRPADVLPGSEELFHAGRLSAPTSDSRHCIEITADGATEAGPGCC